MSGSQSNSKSPIRLEETDFIEKEEMDNLKSLQENDEIDDLESLQEDDNLNYAEYLQENDDIDDTESFQDNDDIGDTESFQDNDDIGDTENLEDNDDIGGSTSFNGNGNEDVKKCDTIIIDVMPDFWTIPKVNKELRIITKTQSIIDGIKSITKLRHLQPRKESRRNGACLVKFHNAQICQLAYSEWTLARLGRLKIFFGLDSIKKLYGPEKRKLMQQKDGGGPPVAKQPKLRRPNPLTLRKKETFGLSHEFLNSLNIELPLSERIYVGNLQQNVNEAKIREVFSLAGQIVHLKLFKKNDTTRPKNFAKVEYDHPVEAVQAISMFHNQNLFSTPMIVHFDFKRGIDLPEGLSEIGPGLGPKGEPLKAVRNHIELGPLKKLLKSARIHPEKILATNTNITRIEPFVQPERPMLAPIANNSPMGFPPPMVAQTSTFPAPAQTQMPMPGPPPNQQNMNPFVAQPMVNPINPFNAPPYQNLQMFQNLNQQNPASYQQAFSALLQNTVNSNTVSGTGQFSDPVGNAKPEWQNQPNIGMQNDKTQPNFSAMENYNSSGYNQSTDNRQRNYDSSRNADRASQESRKSSRDEDKYNKDASDMLLFKNLPRSITLQALKNKMLEVGELKLAEMTGQGRAIVRFVHTRDAERCIKLFNKSKVDGQIVEVRYF